MSTEKMKRVLDGLEIVAYIRKEHHHDGKFVSLPKAHVYSIGDEPLVKLSDVRSALSQLPIKEQ